MSELRIGTDRHHIVLRGWWADIMFLLICSVPVWMILDVLRWAW